MTGYSGTPLPRKLGIKEGALVAILNSPDNFEELLGPVSRARLQTVLAGKKALDVVVFFVTRRAELEKKITAMAEEGFGRGNRCD